MNKNTLIRKLSALAVSGSILAIPSLYANNDQRQQQQAQSGSIEQQAQQNQNQFALEEVLGATVIGATDNTIGEIDNLIFSTQSQSQSYAVISTDDWLDNQKAIVPMSQLELASQANEDDWNPLANQLRFRLNVEEEALDELANVEFDQDDLAGTINQALSSIGDTLDIDEKQINVDNQNLRLASDISDLAEADDDGQQQRINVERILVSLQNDGQIQFVVSNDQGTYQVPADKVEFTAENKIRISEQTDLASYRTYSARFDSDQASAKQQFDQQNQTQAQGEQRSLAQEQRNAEQQRFQSGTEFQIDSEQDQSQAQYGSQEQSRLDYGDREQPTVDLGEARQASEEYADRGQGEPTQSEYRELRGIDEQSRAQSDQYGAASVDSEAQFGQERQASAQLDQERQASAQFDQERQSEARYTQSQDVASASQRSQERQASAEIEAQRQQQGQSQVGQESELELEGYTAAERQGQESPDQMSQPEQQQQGDRYDTDIAGINSSDEDEWVSAKQEWNDESMRNFSDPSALLGVEVRDRQGESLGQVRDVLMRQDTGEAAFVIVETDDWFDSSAALIPIQSVSAQSSQSGQQQAQAQQSGQGEAQAQARRSGEAQQSGQGEAQAQAQPSGEAQQQSGQAQAQNPDAVVIQISEDQFEELATYREDEQSDVNAYLKENRGKLSSTLNLREADLPDSSVVFISASELKKSEG